MNSPYRRYLKHFGAAMIGYAVVLYASISILGRHELSVVPTALLSLSPLVPALYGLHAFVVRFRAMDEYQRRILSESIVWSSGIVGFASFGYAFLEGAVSVPHIGLIWVLPAFIGCHALAATLLFRLNT